MIGATDAHRDALHAALREVHGVEVRDRVRGRSRPPDAPTAEIARALLLDAGVSAERIDERADDVREACCRAYAQLRTEDLSHTVLPGVRELLEWLGGARRRDARPADRQLRGGRAAEADARRDRRVLPARAGRVRLRRRGPRGAARRSRGGAPGRAASRTRARTRS